MTILSLDPRLRKDDSSVDLRGVTTLLRKNVATSSSNRISKACDLRSSKIRLNSESPLEIKLQQRKLNFNFCGPEGSRTPYLFYAIEASYR